MQEPVHWGYLMEKPFQMSRSFASTVILSKITFLYIIFDLQ